MSNSGQSKPQVVSPPISPSPVSPVSLSGGLGICNGAHGITFFLTIPYPFIYFVYLSTFYRFGGRKKKTREKKAKIFCFVLNAACMCLITTVFHNRCLNAGFLSSTLVDYLEAALDHRTVPVIAMHSLANLLYLLWLLLLLVVNSRPCDAGQGSFILQDIHLGLKKFMHPCWADCFALPSHATPARHLPLEFSRWEADPLFMIVCVNFQILLRIPLSLFTQAAALA